MSAKPGVLPVWATGGAIATPSGGKQSLGWVTGERPPAQYLNWYQNLVYIWVLFISGFFTNNGSATGNADIGNTVETSTVPVILARDYLQNRRALIDHNGFRMGQNTELDEVWNSAPVTANVPVSIGIPNSGSWAWNGVGWQATTAGGLAFSLGGIVPPNAFITAINVKIQRGTTTDVTSIFLLGALSGGNTTQLSKSVAAGTGVSTVALFTTPGAGHAPFQVNAANFDDLIVLVNASTVAVSASVYQVQVVYTMPPPGWTAVGNTTDIVAGSVAGDQIVMVDAQSGLNQRGVQLFTTANTAAGQMVLASNFETYIDTTTVYQTEFMLKTGVITDGSNQRAFFAGVKSSGGVFVGLYNDFSLANWQLRIAAANTTTTVAVAAATVYRVRIEIYGTTMNSSGTPKIRLYINGVKVAEVNTALAADKFQPFFSAGTQSGAGGPYDFTIGRLRRCWNHVSSGDNL